MCFFLGTHCGGRRCALPPAPPHPLLFFNRLPLLPTLFRFYSYVFPVVVFLILPFRSFWTIFTTIVLICFFLILICFFFDPLAIGDDPALEPGINIRVTPNGSKWYLQHMFLSWALAKPRTSRYTAPGRTSQVWPACGATKRRPEREFLRHFYCTKDLQQENT